MSNLPKIVKKKKKRVGRGYGSGKGGHTVGRGMKGQKSRGKIGILFEGVKVKKSLIKRLPLWRGKGKFKARKKPIVIKLDYLNMLPAGTKVDLETLISSGIVKEEYAKKYGVKVLGGRKLEKKLSIMVPISKSAVKHVEKAGGKVIGKETKIKDKKSK
jgi:large subunit ribosomal protein L15